VTDNPTPYPNGTGDYIYNPILKIWQPTSAPVVIYYYNGTPMFTPMPHTEPTYSYVYIPLTVKSEDTPNE
jgi:hypothetical protein